jgi:hypothetical protein
VAKAGPYHDYLSLILLAILSAIPASIIKNPTKKTIKVGGKSTNIIKDTIMGRRITNSVNIIVTAELMKANQAIKAINPPIRACK